MTPYKNIIGLKETIEKPLFVAKDVCKILGLANTTEALRNIPEKWRGSFEMSTSNGDQNTNVLTESGLYKLIMKSKKPIAQPKEVVEK